MLRTACSTSLLARNCLPQAIFTNPHSTSMTMKIIYNYHMSYLMDSKHDDRFVKIDRRAFHLYRDSLINFPNQQFNQKVFLTILIDTVRTKQKYEDFQQLAQFGLKHINNFKQSLSIFSFASQLYLYNYPKKQQSYKLAKKGFEFFKTQSTVKYSSYHVMKFLIFLQKNVGLQKFTDQDYKLINFTRFKPLFLSFTLEIFFKNNLQHYSTIQTLFDLFTSSESIIPFADIHHYKLMANKIPDPRYKEFVDKLTKRLLDNHNYGEQLGLNTASKKGRGIDGDGNGNSLENSHQLQGENNYSFSSQQQNLQLTRNNPQQQQQQKASTFQKPQQQQQIKQTRNKSQQKAQFPWQKAYSQHSSRHFSYYPTINYSHLSINVNKNVNTKKN